MRTYFLLPALWLLFGLSTITPQSEPIFLYANQAVDVANGALWSNVTLTIRDGRIEILESQTALPKGQFIDLRGYTILPGLIDCHTHLTGDWYKGEQEFDVYTLPAPYFGIVGVVNARKTLEAGFTTVRDVHGDYYADVALRDAINREWIIGPRMFVTGPGLSITGGHGAYGNWLAPTMRFEDNPASIADGPDEVRRHLMYQVDWIKIFATGGFGSYGTIPGAASYSEEEIRVAVEEAAKRGIKVAAHAHGADGIKNALRAGVSSIEHATYIDDDGIALAKKRGTFLSLDILAAYFDLLEMDTKYDDKALEGSNQEEFDAILDQFGKVYRSGAKIVFGTDAGVYEHGRNAEQFGFMVRAGMSEQDAIKSATLAPAQMLGKADELGQLAEGFNADIIAVSGNPLENIRALENVLFVMKAGQVVKDQTKKE